MGSKYPDNQFNADIAIIRDMAADQFKGIYKAVSSGEFVKRFAELGHTDASGARSISREKEYGFVPKIAGLYPEQINYRIFKNGAGGGSGGGGNTDGTLGDDPGESPGTIDVGIGTNPNEGGGGNSADWDIANSDVGFEVSLVSDLEGQIKNKPDWNPSSMNGENSSTLIISRQKKESEDSGDDLPHRYFGRIVDIIVPIGTNKVSVSRKRFKGGGGGQGGTTAGATFTDESTGAGQPAENNFDPFGGSEPGQDPGTLGLGIGAGGSSGSGGEASGGSFFAKSESSEDYKDALMKGALNISPSDNPIPRTLNREKSCRDDESEEPGPDGWRQHDYVQGHPHVGDGESTPPGNWQQGGWLYDATADTVAQTHDILGIDGFKSKPYPDFKLPRYLNRFGQKVGLAFLRHDAHFAKIGDESSPPPKGHGNRMSGRIYFTKVFKCPIDGVAGGVVSVDTKPVSVGGGGQDVIDPVANTEEEVGTPACGEMIFDVLKANHPDSLIKHESGEWRPLIASGGGGGGDKNDYSYHSKPKKYSGSGTTAGGSPVPGGVATTGQGGAMASASNGTMTTQTQMGTAPPESPGNSQSINIFPNVQTPSVLNPAATWTWTKPVGYSILKLITWIRASDVIPPGQKIEMNIVVGQYHPDGRGPQEFYRKPIFLTPETYPYDKKWHRVTLRWYGLEPRRALPLTFWVERRNDLSNVNVEVWVLRHNHSFEA